MQKPLFENFELQSIKVKNDGGVEVNFYYKYSVGKQAYGDQVKIIRSLPVSTDLWNLLQKQKPNIMKVEELNYRSFGEMLKKAGANDLDMVQQISEGLTQDAMSKIQVTGIRISGKDDKRSGIITYKKITGDKKIAGRTTTAINLNRDVYGFEQELMDDIDTIQNEAYLYLYNNKYSDHDQLDLGLFTKNYEQLEEEPEPEEAQSE